MSRSLLGASRPLTYLLVALLVPLVVVAGPARPAAAAVVAVGPTVTGYIEQSQSGTTFPGGDIDCTITGYTRLHDTGLYSIRATVNCNWGFAYYANFQPERFDLTAHDGDDSASNACRFQAMAVTIQENTNTEATLTAVLQAQGPPPADCVLTSGTLSLDPGTNGGSIDPIPFPWALGSLPTAPESPVGGGDCASFTISQPPVLTSWGVGAVVQGNPTIKYTLKLNGFTWKAGAQYSIIATLAVRNNSTGAIQWARAGGAAETSTPPNGISPAPPTPVPVTWTQYVGGSGLPLGASPSDYTVLGIQINYRFVDASLPPQGNFGLTKPASCMFYFGEKIANTADDFDIPAGPFPTTEGPTPVEEPENVDNPDPGSGDGSCEGFSFTDPTSWAGAGICVLVKAVRALFGVMGEVLQAVLGLPARIMSALGGLLSDLFVPDGALLEANFSEVSDAFADTAPGAWVQALSDFDVPADAATGCAGPDVSVPLGEGIVMEAEPLNACDGAAADLAALCKLILTVTVGFFGGLACIRAVGSGFNWNPGGGAA